MVHLFCIWNNERVLNSMLLATLEAQNLEYELHLIDNRDKEYSSAAEAYNITVASVNMKESDICVFLHQDIQLISFDTLAQIQGFLKSHPMSVVGLAGMKHLGNENHVVSNLQYMDTQQYITRHRTNGIEKVESVDECIFAVRYETFMKVDGFDEHVCNHWHLYGVELCLKVKMILSGDSYVLPTIAYHHDAPPDSSKVKQQMVDKHFLRSLWRMMKKVSWCLWIHLRSMLCCSDFIVRIG